MTPGPVRWTPLAVARGPRGDGRRGPGARRGRLAEMAAVTGLPVVEGAQTAREWALGLLALVAEVEHALMVQYLYGAYSVPAAAAPDGIRYRERLLDIAVQEMGHLATVQNLLLLVGGPAAVHLQRDRLRRASSENPVPFVLEPVSRAALAKYVTVEAPAEVPAALVERVAALAAIAEADAGVALHRVGALYEVVRHLFGAEVGLDALYPPGEAPPRLVAADLVPAEEVVRYQASREEWSAFEESFILQAPVGLGDGLAAVEAVAAQGEGLLDVKASSHFEEFLAVADAFDAGQVSALPIARSPCLGPDGGEQGTVIEHPYTRLWGAVFAGQYQLLVLSIQHALVLPRPGEEPGLRGSLAASAVGRMRSVIGRLSGLLAALPLTAAGPALAGPPYDLDPPLLDEHDPALLPAAHLALLDALAARYAEIEGAPDFAAHPDHRITLANLRATDRRHRQLFV